MYGIEYDGFVDYIRACGEPDVFGIDVQIIDETGMYKSYSFDEVEVMEYTGKKDKDGMKIYEGDIVRFFDKINYEIKFGFYDNEEWYEDHEGGYGWYREGRGVVMGMYSEDIMARCEIIGNIYENPELLSK